MANFNTFVFALFFFSFVTFPCHCLGSCALEPDGDGHVTIPDGAQFIGDRAFFYCSSLSTITIPDSVTSIGEYAFYACSSLSTITIPKSVTSIGDYAFSLCACDKTLYVAGTSLCVCSATCAPTISPTISPTTTSPTTTSPTISPTTNSPSSSPITSTTSSPTTTSPTSSNPTTSPTSTPPPTPTLTLTSTPPPNPECDIYCIIGLVTALLGFGTCGSLAYLKKKYRKKRGCQRGKDSDSEEKCPLKIVAGFTFCNLHLCPDCKKTKSSNEKNCRDCQKKFKGYLQRVNSLGESVYGESVKNTVPGGNLQTNPVFALTKTPSKTIPMHEELYEEVTPSKTIPMHEELYEELPTIYNFEGFEGEGNDYMEVGKSSATEI